MLNKKVNGSMKIVEEMFNSIIKEIEENDVTVYLQLVGQNRHNYRPVWHDEVIINRSAEKVILKLLSYKNKKSRINIKKFTLK